MENKIVSERTVLHLALFRTIQVSATVSKWLIAEYKCFKLKKEAGIIIEKSKIKLI